MTADKHVCLKLTTFLSDNSEDDLRSGAITNHVAYTRARGFALKQVKHMLERTEKDTAAADADDTGAAEPRGSLTFDVCYICCCSLEASGFLT